MANVTGVPQLQARLKAIGGASLPKLLGLATVREAKFLVHRKTGTTGRSIRVTAQTEHSVTVSAGFGAVFLEEGTRPHEITPRAARALRWAASPAGRRLSGSPRIGAAVVFATRVHHPGSKPYPFLVPGAKRAVASEGAKAIITAWNSAA